MSLYEVWKLLHVIAAILWIGGGAMIIQLNFRLVRSRDAATMGGLARATATMGKSFFMPVTIATLVFGVLMVLEADGIGFGDAWITIGFGGVIVSGLIGMFVIEKTTERLGEVSASEGPDSTAAQALGQKIGQWAMIDLVILLFVTWAMVAKPGL